MSRRAVEHEEQSMLVRWAMLAAHRLPELRLLFAVPNAAKRGGAAAARLKAEGLRAGVPDLWLPVPRGPHHGLVIEMKPSPHLAGRKRYPTEPQKEWLAALEAQGYAAHVCWGFEEARAVIEAYLALPPARERKSA